MTEVTQAGVRRMSVKSQDKCAFCGKGPARFCLKLLFRTQLWPTPAGYVRADDGPLEVPLIADFRAAGYALTEVAPIGRTPDTIENDMQVYACAQHEAVLERLSHAFALLRSARYDWAAHGIPEAMRNPTRMDINASLDSFNKLLDAERVLRNAD